MSKEGLENLPLTGHAEVKKVGWLIEWLIFTVYPHFVGYLKQKQVLDCKNDYFL